MKLIPNVFSLNGINDSAFSYVSVPGVKLYADKVRYTATVSPAPPAGNITISFLNRTNNSLQDTLTSYPDSLKVRIKTSGGVTSGSYTITVTATGRIGGQNGPPIHKRTITLTVLTGITNYNNEVPDNFYLYQNFPNPFNPKTNIRFDIAKTGKVILSVFDVSGKQVAELINGEYSAGKYIADFDAKDLSSGIYFYKIETKDFVSVRKMILVK
jgi:hypothetical protein